MSASAGYHSHSASDASSASAASSHIRSLSPDLPSLEDSEHGHDSRGLWDWHQQQQQQRRGHGAHFDTSAASSNTATAVPSLNALRQAHAHASPVKLRFIGNGSNHTAQDTAVNDDNRIPLGSRSISSPDARYSSSDDADIDAVDNAGGQMAAYPEDEQRTLETLGSGMTANKQQTGLLLSPQKPVLRHHASDTGLVERSIDCLGRVKSPPLRSNQHHHQHHRESSADERQESSKPVESRSRTADQVVRARSNTLGHASASSLTSPSQYTSQLPLLSPRSSETATVTTSEYNVASPVPFSAATISSAGGAGGVAYQFASAVSSPIPDETSIFHAQQQQKPHSSRQYSHQQQQQYGISPYPAIPPRSASSSSNTIHSPPAVAPPTSSSSDNTGTGIGFTPTFSPDLQPAYRPARSPRRLKQEAQVDHHNANPSDYEEDRTATATATATRKTFSPSPRLSPAPVLREANPTASSSAEPARRSPRISTTLPSTSSRKSSNNRTSPSTPYVTNDSPTQLPHTAPDALSRTPKTSAREVAPPVPHSTPNDRAGLGIYTSGTPSRARDGNDTREVTPTSTSGTTIRQSQRSPVSHDQYAATPPSASGSGSGSGSGRLHVKQYPRSKPSPSLSALSNALNGLGSGDESVERDMEKSFITLQATPKQEARTRTMSRKEKASSDTQDTFTHRRREHESFSSDASNRVKTADGAEELHDENDKAAQKRRPDLPSRTETAGSDKPPPKPISRNHTRAREHSGSLGRSTALSSSTNTTASALAKATRSEWSSSSPAPGNNATENSGERSHGSHYSSKEVRLPIVPGMDRISTFRQIDKSLADVLSAKEQAENSERAERTWKAIPSISTPLWYKAPVFGRLPNRPMRAHTATLVPEQLTHPSTISATAPRYANYTPFLNPAHLDDLINLNCAASLWVFGGIDGKTCFKEMYKLDLDSMCWTKPRCKDPDGKQAPPALRAHSMTYIPPFKSTGKKGVNEESMHGHLLLFGGGDGPHYFNDIYLLNLTTLTWRKPTTPPFVEKSLPGQDQDKSRYPQQSIYGSIPSPRRAHTSVWYDKRKELVVFGGGNGSKALNETYVLECRDWSRLNWKKIETTGKKPRLRGYHTMNLVGDKAVVYGGSDGVECFSDVFLLDLETFAWSEIPIYSPSLCCPRLSHSATLLSPSQILIYGGHDGSDYKTSLTIFSLSTGQFYEIPEYKSIEPPSASSKGDDERLKSKTSNSGMGGPLKRGYHTATLHNGRLILLGGFDGKHHFDDTWCLEAACISAFYP